MTTAQYVSLATAHDERVADPSVKSCKRPEPATAGARVAGVPGMQAERREYPGARWRGGGESNTETLPKQQLTDFVDLHAPSPGPHKYGPVKLSVDPLALPQQCSWSRSGAGQTPSGPAL